MKGILVMVAGTALLAATSVHAEEWRAVSASDKAMTWVDLDSLRSSGNVRMFNSLTVTRVTQVVAGKGSDYYITRYRVDCALETLQVTHVAGYTEDGSVVVASGISGGPEPVNPRSGHFDLMRAVCDGLYAGRRDQTLPDPLQVLRFFRLAAR
ncbi:surface-adhesin E family protein [Brevundimonas sp.]|uniref:surface-adhesin E family protein n=1 Tax=Brevundimonas sp. TaxID=1871086 RepID=UPI0028981B3A|nr:surface-adhesin E family protein [Brevundimonas sp.]